MNFAWTGFLIGLAVAAFLLAFEYMAIAAEVRERSKRLARKVDWDQNQRARMRGMMTFGLALPIAFAVGGWWIWG